MNKISHTTCPICHSDEIRFALSSKDYTITQENFELYDCNSCKIRFTQNPPSEQVIGKYYDSPSYISHSNDQSTLSHKIYHWVRGYMLNKKYQLIRSLTKGKSLLDIGSGTGYFLNFMKEKEYQVKGIEINEAARNFSISNFGLNVYPPDELLNQNLADRFDIISLWHVLEHLYHPKQYLEVISKYLKEEGILLIAVPNHQSTDARYYKEYWAGYDVPRHLWHFNKESIIQFVEVNNFRFYGSYRLPFDAFYVSILSEKYKNNSLSFLKGIWHGGISWWQSLFNIRHTSSLIYVFKKSK